MYIIMYIIMIKNNNNLEIDYRFFNSFFVIDSLNISLILLTILIRPILSLLKIKREEKRKIDIIMINILFILMTNDIFNFFIFYEILLIPLFFYLLDKGSFYLKLEASYRLFLYTLLGSLLLLFSLIYIFFFYGSLNIEFLSFVFNPSLFSFLWFFMILSFLIKFPVFPFHIWLPVVHVESPTVGSIILAAIILKIAYYGIIKYIIPLFKDINFYYSPFIYILALISILYASIININEIDMKKIIAYSSIIHMNYSLFGLFSHDFSSLISSYIIMLSHGFISAALFILIGILYIRYHSRNYYYFKSLISYMPLYSFFFIFMILSNISIPYTSSFIPEMVILFHLINDNLFISLIFLFSIFFSSIYNLWFLNRIIFGSFSPFISLYLDLSFNEFLILFPFLFFILSSSFYFSFFSSLLSPSFILLL